MLCIAWLSGINVLYFGWVSIETKCEPQSGPFLVWSFHKYLWKLHEIPEPTKPKNRKTIDQGPRYGVYLSEKVRHSSFQSLLHGPFRVWSFHKYLWKIHEIPEPTKPKNRKSIDQGPRYKDWLSSQVRYSSFQSLLPGPFLVWSFHKYLWKLHEIPEQMKPKTRKTVDQRPRHKDWLSSGIRYSRV